MFTQAGAWSRRTTHNMTIKRKEPETLHGKGPPPL